MTLACTKQELIEITGKVRPSAQARVLRFMGIDHRPRPNGTLFVHRKLVDHLLGPADSHSTPAPSWEPNYERLT